MNDQATGSCLCGAVRFRVHGAFEHFFLCYCSRCRKGSGSAHAANVFASDATVEWLSGEEKVRVFELPATRHAKCFCSVCGSALPRASAGRGLVVVPAGSLDTPLKIRADARISYASRADWVDELDCVETIDGLPG